MTNVQLYWLRILTETISLYSGIKNRQYGIVHTQILNTQIGYIFVVQNVKNFGIIAISKGCLTMKFDKCKCCGEILAEQYVPHWICELCGGCENCCSCIRGMLNDE